MTHDDLDVEALLLRLQADSIAAGGDFEFEQSRRGWRARCPSPTHPDRDPSWEIIDSPGSEKHGSHHCRSCHFGGGPWEVAAAVWVCDILEAGRRLGHETATWRPPRNTVRRVGLRAKWDGIPVPAGVVVTPLNEWPARYREYVEGRGCSASQVEDWRLGYAASGPLIGRVFVPNLDERGRLLTWTARDITGDSDRRYLEAAEEVCSRCGVSRGRDKQGQLFDACLCGCQVWLRSRKSDALHGAHLAVPIDDRVTVFEGTFSGLALERAGWPNPHGLWGTDVEGGALATRLRGLARFEGPFFLCTDPDDAGRRAARRLAVLDGLFGVRRRVVQVDLPLSPDDCDHDDLVDLCSGALARCG